MSTVTKAVELQTVGCRCGWVFGVPKAMYDRAYEKGGYGHWRCPNPACGSRTFGWGEGEVDRANRNAESARRSAARELERRLSAERSARAVRGHLTRAKKRAAAGTCPCCKRTFANMERHMTKQHPDFVESVR